MRNTYLAVGIIVVLIVAIAFAAVRTKLPQLKRAEKQQPTPTPIAEVQKATIAVGSHTPARLVVVDSVTLKKPGFVAIHEMKNQKPGVIIGTSQLLTDDTHTNITIPLSRKTVDGEMLLAMVHVDNGDGIFDPATDDSAKDENGNELSLSFAVSSQTGELTVPATGLGE